MDISIIIVNYNSLEFIKKCMESIEGLIDKSGINCEVLVVDNNSEDGSAGYLKKKSAENSRIRLIANKNNPGFSRASNTGALEAEGRYLLFLNPDTRIISGKLRDLIDFYDGKKDSEAKDSVGKGKSGEDKKIKSSSSIKTGRTGVVGAKILNADGTVQLSARSFPTLARQFYESYFLYRIFKRSRVPGSYFLSWWDHQDIKEVDWLTGSFMFIRKDIFLKAGKFSQDYFMYSEDAELCLKLHKMNFKNYYFPYFVIEHADSGIASREPAVREAEIWRSRRLYFKKNYSTAHALALSMLYLAGIINRICVFTILAVFKPGGQNKDRLISYFRALRLYYKRSAA